MAQVACSKHIGSQPGDTPVRRLWEDLHPPPQPATELLNTGRYNWHSNRRLEGETPARRYTRLYQPLSGYCDFVATWPNGPQSYTIPLESQVGSCGEAL